ncbi:MAG TPA: hypothetical protein VFV73_32055 [Streptosporangiaceae bacterium]|nr:hypothetical protein [Streptosporangiaceae bacterium]
MPLAQAYRGYTKTMWDRLSALATWQPDVTLSVGDVVTAGAGGVVTRETTLADLSAPRQLTSLRREAAAVREHSGVTISASGSAVVAAAGKARASFAGESSFLVVTSQGWTDATERMADARAIVEDLAARQLWKPGWHLVTSVRSYPACTIVIAKNAGAEAEVAIDLSAAGVAVPEGIRAGVAVSVNSDHASHWVMSFDSTPFYEAIGMKRRGLLRRANADTVEYLTRDHDVTEAVAPLSEDEVIWTAQRSSPFDLGLL